MFRDCNYLFDAGSCYSRNVLSAHVLISFLLLGSISQTLTYPFDVLRRKMQVAGMKGGSVKYNGAVHALRSIIQTEGVAGLYRGLWPNLRVSWPPVSCSPADNRWIWQSKWLRASPHHSSRMNW